MSWVPVPLANGWTVGSSRQDSSSKPKRAHHLELELLLRARAGSSARAGAGPLGSGDQLDERRLMLLEVLEQRAHLGASSCRARSRRGPRRTARRSRRRSSRCTAGAARGSRAARAGTTRSRCRVAPRPRPACASDGGARHLGPQLGRHLPRLLPVAPGDADEARLERVVARAPPRTAPSSLEQPPDLGGGELLVRDPPQASRAARRGRARRGGGIITCWSQPSSAGGAPEIADLGHPPAQLLERRRSRQPTVAHRQATAPRATVAG